MFYSEMKATLAAFEAKDEEPLKQQNAMLQQQTIQLQEDVREMQIKMKKMREVGITKRLIMHVTEPISKQFIRQQDNMVKSMKSGKTDGNYDEAVASLKAELAIRDEENERLTVCIYFTHPLYDIFIDMNTLRNNYVKLDCKQEENNNL